MKTFIVNEINPMSFSQIEVDRPKAKGRDLLIEVKSVSLGSYDNEMRPTHMGKTLGFDASGIVAEVGEGVQDFKVGDEVYYTSDMKRSGTNSEFQIVDERLVSHKPSNLNFAQAATLPLASIMAFDSLFDKLQVDPERSRGQTILIIDGGNSIGAMATQLASKITNLTIITTADDMETKEFSKKMGADLTINSSLPIATQLKRMGIDKVDYILCASSPNQYIRRLRAIVSKKTRMVSLFSTRDEFLPNDFVSALPEVEQEFVLVSSSGIVDHEEYGNYLREVTHLVEAGALKPLVAMDLGEISTETLEKGHGLINQRDVLGNISLSF
ncbi:alcohol dehydrogenase catalytic domain-containing protein [Halobacteriovorax sp. XZX-3]|uniref:alcohol dehydrogenase catalytic domain-containing protein n=1 Tax=unclassified Halobacteriovorax TaxID=2639665 RepID=UPI00371772B9